MIVVCSQCTTRLQLDDAKLPSRPFTIRCPKCQQVINAQPPAAAAQGGEQQGALGLGESPSLEHPRFKQSAPAPAFNPDVAGEQTEVQAFAQPSSVDTDEVVRMLAALLQGGVPGKEAQTGAAVARTTWERRRALVCATPAHREALAHQLAESNYQVFVAEDSSQAIERMREERMDVVILDPGFDPVEQGAAFVTREVSIKRPGERRRLFFVHLNASSRTLDSHAAFVSNVNMVVNPADIESLPHVLERALRDFNELYREFNNVQSAPAI